MVALSVVEGCSDAALSRDENAISIDDGASVGESATGLLTPGAPLSLTLKTGARLTFPASAVRQAIGVTVRRPPDPEAKRLARSIGPAYRLASAPYVLTPHRTRFALPARLELPVDPARTSRVVVAWLEDERDTHWKILGTPTRASRSVATSLEHFSVIALLELVAPTDAGIGPARDAETMIDAAQTDANPGEAEAGARSDTQRFIARIEECGLVERPGDVSAEVVEPIVASRYETCEFECGLAASCEEFRRYTDICDEDHVWPGIDACLAACLGHALEVDCLSPSGEALTGVRACDGIAACADGFDERACPEGSRVDCHDGTFVAADRRCDAERDCEDGSDESDCPASAFFVCDDGERVGAYEQCDGRGRCSDGSDELRCEGRTFACADGTATIPARAVCDLSSDCEDGSDEPARCLKFACGASR